MNFNFNETAGKSQSNEKKQLEGNKIHEVIFDGCEIKDLQSKDQSQTYKVLNINFHNDEGVFTHTVWEPREADMQDTDGMFGKQPSNVKSMMLTFKHLIDAVNPSLGALIDNGVKISVSSRGVGSVKNGIVENFKLITYDFVSYPSDFNATMNGMVESYKLNEGILDKRFEYDDFGNIVEVSEEQQIKSELNKPEVKEAVLTKFKGILDSFK